MMTTRLYYTDALLRSFEATVLACDTSGTSAEVVLDRTAFYPSSGGQPFDTGVLGGVRVTDVIDGDDGIVRHVVASPLAVGARVHGEIDWPRRLDHMQQHTGQHVLSAAFDHLFGVRTTSFHLGAEASTIDLAREVTPAEIGRAEAEANRVVWDNRPVVVRFASEEEASRLPLRKEPARTGRLRIVEVTDFDFSACGGTHVPETGAIGIIAVAGWERFKGATRLSFVCGARALRSHGALRDVVAAATRTLSVTPGELAAAIERLQQDGKALGRAIRKLQEEVAAARARDIRAEAETIGGRRVVIRAEPGWDAAALKLLASAIVSEAGLVAVLVGDGSPVPVVAARSADVEWDAGAFIRRGTAELGGRGGGRPEIAQAGIPADSHRILAFVRASMAG
jgi:alanyl-tRNA synthetase